MTVRIITGDCREVLKTLPDESVHCVVTSPPYFGLRDYGVDGQIGLEPTPDAFVAEIVAVFREVRRVLQSDGVCFLNLGDSYFGSNQTGGTKSKEGSAKRAGRMFSKPAGVRRAIACDTPGTEPEGSQASDCLCGSLCDACRAAYRLGISRSGSPLAPMPAPSIGASSPAHKGSLSDRPPTSGSTRPDGRSEAATPDHGLVVPRAAEQPHDAPASKTPVSSPPPQGEPRLSGRPLECLSCGCSLPDCVPVSARMAGCICGTSSNGSASDNLGMGASGSAYPHLTTKSLKPKDLIGIPWRVAFALQADGWWLRQDIIWSKPNPMPESVTDRCTKAHEYLFLLAKSERYFYDAAAVAEPANPEHFGRYNYDFTGGKEGMDSAMPQGRTITPKGSRVAKETRNRRSVWSVTIAGFPGAHFATFPPALIEPCIKAGCPKNGTVLDPFGGAGTTGLVADRLGRNAILIELNPEYAAMAQKRIAGDAGMFAEVAA